MFSRLVITLMGRELMGDLLLISLDSRWDLHTIASSCCRPLGEGPRPPFAARLLAALRLFKYWSKYSLSASDVCTCSWRDCGKRSYFSDMELLLLSRMTLSGVLIEDKFCSEWVIDSETDLCGCWTSSEFRDCTISTEPCEWDISTDPCE